MSEAAYLVSSSWIKFRSLEKLGIQNLAKLDLANATATEANIELKLRLIFGNLSRIEEAARKIPPTHQF